MGLGGEREKGLKVFTMELGSGGTCTGVNKEGGTYRFLKIEGYVLIITRSYLTLQSEPVTIVNLLGLCYIRRVKARP